ncbi:LysR family transcriptional regulator, partial [Rhizobium leguminosarum]
FDFRDDIRGGSGSRQGVVAEIESVTALSAAVLEGLGSTIIPASVVTETAIFSGAQVRALTKQVIDATVSLCVADHLPLSEPAIA